MEFVTRRAEGWRFPPRPRRPAPTVAGAWLKYYPAVGSSLALHDAMQSAPTLPPRDLNDYPTADPLGGNHIPDGPLILCYIWRTKTKETAGPKTLLQATRYFASPDTCLEWMVQSRWPNGVKCPRCGSTNVGFLAKGRRWKCYTKHEDNSPWKFSVSVRVGTVFEDSPIGLDKWFVAMWLLGNCKNGISSYELARDVKVTQKTAWFMLQRIRLAMQQGSFEKIGGKVEVDETYIGGAARYMHRSKRAEKIKGTGGMGKVAVMGLLARHRNGKGHSTVRTSVVQNVKRPTLHEQIKEDVEPGSQIFSDALKPYDQLPPDYVHKVINHAECYAKGNVHTDGLKNFWSLTERMIKGTFVSVEPFHLFRYLDGESFRFSERKHKTWRCWPIRRDPERRQRQAVDVQAIDRRTRTHRRVLTCCRPR